MSQRIKSALLLACACIFAAGASAAPAAPSGITTAAPAGAAKSAPGQASAVAAIAPSTQPAPAGNATEAGKRTIVIYRAMPQSTDFSRAFPPLLQPLFEKKVPVVLRMVDGNVFLQSNIITRDAPYADVAGPGTVTAMPGQLEYRVVVDKPGQMKTLAYLGISTSPVPDVLREQLKLPDGVGLVVEFVEPKGPAETAGLKKYDVLHKLNDQLLINGEQFAVLVRNFKKDQQVKLTVIRQGEEKTITATVGEHQVAVESGVDTQAVNTIVSYDKVMMPKEVQATVDGSIMMLWSDDDCQLALSTTNGKDRRLRITDKAGNVIYDGPTDEADLAKIPAKYREKLKSLEQATKVQVHTAVQKFSDDLCDIEVQVISPTEQRLTIKDRNSGKIVYDGPTDPADLAKIPQEYRNRYELLMKPATIEVSPAPAKAKDPAKAPTQQP